MGPAGSGALVDGEHGADALAERLAQHRLGLHAHALDDVHHHQRAVRDAQRGRDLRREVDVARGVDQVDQVVVALRQVSTPSLRCEQLVCFDAAMATNATMNGAAVNALAAA